MTAAMPVKRRCPWDGDAETVIDRGEPAGGQHEALAIVPAIFSPSDAGVQGDPCFRRQPGAGSVELTAP
jgi:hypothetical protein